MNNKDMLTKVVNILLQAKKEGNHYVLTEDQYLNLFKELNKSFNTQTVTKHIEHKISFNGKTGVVEINLELYNLELIKATINIYFDKDFDYFKKFYKKYQNLFSITENKGIISMYMEKIYTPNCYNILDEILNDLNIILKI